MLVSRPPRVLRQGVAHGRVLAPFVDSLGVGRPTLPPYRPPRKDDGRIRLPAEPFIVFQPETRRSCREGSLGRCGDPPMCSRSQIGRSVRWEDRADVRLDSVPLAPSAARRGATPQDRPRATSEREVRRLVPRAGLEPATRPVNRSGRNDLPSDADDDQLDSFESLADSWSTVIDRRN